MERLTGNGSPTSHLPGEVGQHYEDLLTGDIYECRIASKYSPLHGAPIGGYVWELRAKGEDIQDGLLGGGGASSWNDLKDKPFGEVPAEVAILPEETVTIQSFDGVIEGALSKKLEFEIGKKYTVVWDGTVYECEAKLNEWDRAYIGNPSLEYESSMPSTDEPFYFSYVGGRMFASSEHAGTFTVAIYTDGVSVKTIDTKYLPEPLQIGAEQIVIKIADTTESNPQYSERLQSYYFTPRNKAGVDIEPGMHLKATVDGKEYEGVAEEYTFYDSTRSEVTVIGIGNKSIIDQNGENTGEDIFIGVEADYRDSVSVYFTEYVEDGWKISIQAEVEEVKTIDPKYLPERVESLYKITDYRNFSDDQWVELAKKVNTLPLVYVDYGDVKASIRARVGRLVFDLYIDEDCGDSLHKIIVYINEYKLEEKEISESTFNEILQAWEDSAL